MMEKLRNFVRTHGVKYLKDRNISSVGIGYKIKDGKRTNEVSIQFTVDKKAEPEMLESMSTSSIPESFDIDGVTVPTDVIQRKYAAEYRVVSEAITSDRKKRMDPVMPGISVANAKETAGTIGCIVYDRTSGAPYILSNWHVLNGSKGLIGDDIVQPGPYDDNRTHLNKVGKLVRSHLGHAGDCAVATIDERNIRSDVMDLAIVVEKLGVPEIGDKVIKSGRTTGVTHGIVSRVDVISKIPYDEPTGEQEIGCFEIEPDSDNLPDNGEVSMGGDSGSVWVFKSNNGQPTNIMAGLHFAGEGSTNPNEHALACYPKSVFEKLDISLLPTSGATRARTIGFLEDFLSSQVDLPKLSASTKRDSYMANGSEIIDYTHFSLALNKARRFAIWVGWNIDGGQIRKLGRKNLQFVLDSNIPDEFQVGNELYAGNRLDRGHIARRADLVWGNLEEAKKANKDSFFYTNISPQMDNFNQSKMGGLWGRLEDAVFEDTDVEDLKVSLFGGPVFRDDDREFRGVKLPRDFWKVIAFVENHKLKSKGFLLTQSLDELEALDLDQFKVYQVPLSEIETRCGIVFSDALKTADSIGERLGRRPESIAKLKPLESTEDIDWS